MANNTDDSRIRLSSSATFGTRLFVVPFTVVVSSLFVVFSFIELGARWYTYLGIIIWFIVVFPSAGRWWRLCEVEADDRGLMVKRGRLKEFVPYENVVKVSSGSTDAWQRITVETLGASDFGNTFSFMPIVTSRFSPERPTLQWLEEKVRKASRGSVSAGVAE